MDKFSIADDAVAGVVPQFPPPAPIKVKQPPVYPIHSFDLHDWRDTPEPTFQDLIRTYLTPKSRGPVGSKDNPYELVVPRWMEDRAVAAGTTMQEMANDQWPWWTVEVTVLDDYR